MDDDSKKHLIHFPFEEEARRGHRVFEDGVVRWAATDIACWAGAVAPRNVKSTVEDNREEFERLGSLHPLRANPDRLVVVLARSIGSTSSRRFSCASSFVRVGLRRSPRLDSDYVGGR